MGCGNSKISSANIIVLGVIQIIIGIYHVFMWYFLLLLYMGQIKGVFGIYEPITYKTGTSLWGLAFVISGAFTVKAAKYRSKSMLLCTMSLNILCIIITVVAASLTIVELAHFRSVSYRNYGQALWFPHHSSNEEISAIANELNNVNAPDILYIQCIFIINITLFCVQLIMEGVTILDGLQGVPEKKLGREVSRILLCSYPLEFGIALTYSICYCLDEKPEEHFESVTEVVEGNP